MIKNFIERFDKTNFPLWLEFLAASITGILFAFLFYLGFIL
jgi:uncharacterized integral membrane protein